MKQILVPTDFSKTSEVAIDFAVHIAELLKAKITLLHSFEVAEGNFTDLMGVNQEFTNDLINESKLKLEDLCTAFMKESAVEIDSVISFQPLSTAIIEVGEARKIDLIVMGTLGATGLKSKLWGSNTSNVIGKTKIPVMAIPSDYLWKKPQSVLLATREFERNGDILDYFYELTYLLSSSVKTVVFTGDDELAEIYLESQKLLEDYEKFLKAEYRDDTVSSVHLTGGSFAESLQAYIDENEIDLLTMITYQEGFWRSLFNPSATRLMSFHSKIPLLVIPSGFKS